MKQLTPLACRCRDSLSNALRSNLKACAANAFDIMQCSAFASRKTTPTTIGTTSSIISGTAGLEKTVLSSVDGDPALYLDAVRKAVRVVKRCTLCLRRFTVEHFTEHEPSVSV